MRAIYMPTYEYACSTCGKEFEVFQSMKDAALTVCNCGKSGQVRRKIGSGAGLIFKGSGFYETDYKRPASKPADSAPAKTETKTESKPAPSSPSTPAKS